MLGLIFRKRNESCKINREDGKQSEKWGIPKGDRSDRWGTRPGERLPRSRSVAAKRLEMANPEERGAGGGFSRKRDLTRGGGGQSDFKPGER